MAQNGGNANMQILTPMAKPEDEAAQPQDVPSLSPMVEEKDVKRPTLAPTQKPVSPKEQSIPGAPQLEDEIAVPLEPEPEPESEPVLESKVEEVKPEPVSKPSVNEEKKVIVEEKPKVVESPLPPSVPKTVPVQQKPPPQPIEQQKPKEVVIDVKEKPDVANLDEIELEEEEIEDEVLKGIEPTIDSIPNNLHAKLMYYLFCVDNVLHLSKNRTNIGRYIKYRDYNLTQAERSKLIVWATVLHPMILEKKCILHSDEICGNDNDILYARRSDVAEYLAQGNDEKDSEFITINDIKIKITEVLIYKTSWLDLYYNNPQSIIGKGNNTVTTPKPDNVVINVEEEVPKEEERKPEEVKKEESEVEIPIDDNDEEVAGVHIQKELPPSKSIEDIEEIPSAPEPPKQEPIKDPKDKKKKKKKHYRRPPKKTYKYAGVIKCNRCCTCCCNILRPFLCFVGLAFIELIGVGEVMDSDTKYNTTDFNKLCVTMTFALLGIIIELMEACISCKCKLLDSLGYRVYCIVNTILFILLGVYVAINDNITPVYIPFLVAFMHILGVCWV